MALSVAARNVGLDAIGAVAVYASLHTADPSTTGANEVAGGTYTREAITWNAATGAGLDNNANPVFDVPAATTITHFGLWSAATAGTWYGGDELSDAEVYAAAGTYALNDVDITLT